MLPARWLITLSILALVCCSCSAARSERTGDDGTAKATALADSDVKEYVQPLPYQALLSGAPDVYSDRLADNSLAALNQWHEREDSMLSSLRQIPVTSVEGKPAEVTYKFLQNQLESSR